MRLQNIILAAIVLCTGLVLCIGFVFDSYQPENYNVTISENDTKTYYLYDLQEQAQNYINDSQTGSITSTINQTECNVPGGACSTFDPNAGSTESTFFQSSLSALSFIRTIGSVFTSLIQALFNIVGLSITAKQALILLIVSMITLPITFMLINTFFRNPL